MVIDISLYALAAFVIQTFAWVTLSLILFLFMFYSDSVEPFKDTPIKNSIFAAIVVVLFLLIYGIVQINWLP